MSFVRDEAYMYQGRQDPEKIKEQIIKTDQVEGTKGNFTMFQFCS